MKHQNVSCPAPVSTFGVDSKILEYKIKFKKKTTHRAPLKSANVNLKGPSKAFRYVTRRNI